MISVIVPVLDEADALPRSLRPLQVLRGRGIEVVVVDGGSRDGTRDAAAPLCDRILDAPRGRARQMNAGAGAAGGGVLLFLHADTQLPSGWSRMVRDALGDRKHAWGRFDVRLDGAHPMLRVVERAMNLRSRLSGIATGDQAIFVTRAAFRAAGGFPEIALMEDVALSRDVAPALTPCLSARRGGHVEPALGTAWNHPHHRADVAAEAAIRARRRSRDAGPPVPGRLTGAVVAERRCPPAGW